MVRTFTSVIEWKMHIRLWYDGDKLHQKFYVIDEIMFFGQLWALMPTQCRDFHRVDWRTTIRGSSKIRSDGKWAAKPQGVSPYVKAPCWWIGQMSGHLTRSCTHLRQKGTYTRVMEQWLKLWRGGRWFWYVSKQNETENRKIEYDPLLFTHTGWSAAHLWIGSRLLYEKASYKRSLW